MGYFLPVTHYENGQEPFLEKIAKTKGKKSSVLKMQMSFGDALGKEQYQTGSHRSP